MISQILYTRLSICRNNLTDLTFSCLVSPLAKEAVLLKDEQPGKVCIAIFKVQLPTGLTYNGKVFFRCFLYFNDSTMFCFQGRRNLGGSKGSYLPCLLMTEAAGQLYPKLTNIKFFYNPNL